MFIKPLDEINFSNIKTFCEEYSEGVRVEYKQEISEIRKHIPKIVSSFANTQGGILLIGVKTDEQNHVNCIPGIPIEQGIEERITQSALTGIYPPVMPEIKICDVPESTGNVVVIVRVNESQQAPHALQNSNQVYIRVGSITQPYELADIDRIEYLLKRRERPQEIVPQILSRMDNRAQACLEEPYKSNPYLTLICHPVFPYRPIIPPPKILGFLRSGETQRNPHRVPFKEGVADFGTRKVSGGVCFVMGSRYYEVNEYGILYYGKVLHENHRQGSPPELNTIKDYDIIHEIYKLIHVARVFHQECEYSGNIEIHARLRQIDGWKLNLGKPHSIHQIPPIESEVSASTQCLPPSFLKVKDCIDVIMDLSDELFWGFDVQSYGWRGDWKNKLEKWFLESGMVNTQNE